MNTFITFPDLLRERKLLTDDVIASVQAEALKFKISFEQQLVTQKLMKEDDIAKLKAEYTGLETKDLSDTPIDQKMVEIIPEDVAEHYQVVAFGGNETELFVGIVDPLDYQATEAVQFLAKERRKIPHFYVITSANLQNALKKYRMLGKEVTEVVEEAEEKMKAPEKALGAEEKKMEEIIRSAPVSKIVTMILRFAVDNRASDIHIEPMGEEKTRVRYRIDGDMRTSLVLPGQLHASLVSRLKVLSNLKLDETRVPQDGRIKFQTENQVIDLRLSTLPLTGREKVVMRVLDSSKGVPTLKALGFRPGYIGLMERNISKPHGLFLITGPTGSGKSTTLYAALNSVTDDTVNVVTMEDPVEYTIPGINQSQVNPDVGLTFAAGLRSILRQDPDIIMVGEIRDGETASLAVQAGLTGHLVFSTLHTNDAFGAVPRLIDMGLQPFLLVSTLNLVMAQRLVRTICDKCKEENELPSTIIAEITKELETVPKDMITAQFPTGSIIVKSYKGKGCTRCANTGYKGRTTVAEYIEMTRELQKIVVEGNNAEKVREEVQRQGMITMKQDGILKVLAGITTMEEVIAVTVG